MASVLINSFVKGVTDWLSLIRRTPTTSSTAITVADDLERLKRMLQRIVVVLQDAEEREIVDKSVKLWLTEIKDVADDAQDLLDEYQYEVLRAQIENRDIAAAETAAQASRRKDEVITPFASSSSSASNIAASKISILSDMADRIKKIREKLDEISEDRKNLHLKPTDGQRRRDSCYEYPPPTSHMIDEQGICGREDDRKKLIDWLFSNKESKYEVLAVVGMGGLGKTTLAQLVYNVPKVEDYFQQRMWICVSRDFDPKRLTRAMIESITGDPCALSELSALQSSLQQKLDGKRVLLVLDDVWNEKQSLWETLRRPFVSAEMIRIIVTTRNISVAEVMQTTDPHRLGHLPEEQCRRLFMRLAFRDRDPKEFPSLVGIGEEIVKKCDGLPLAVKSLGALLQPEGRRNGEGRWSDEGRWKEVLHSGLWDEETDILPALKLSYTRMPSVLKPCFQICSVFPKAYKFGKDELVNLWAAQGYIEVEHNIGKHNTMDMGEEIGYKYFNELRRRSFFDELPGVGKEEQRRYKMHDIIHDLACYLLEGERKMRHLSVENESPELHLDDKIEGLRTLIVGPVIYDIPVIHDMLGRTTRRRRTHLRYLKILLHSPFSLAEGIRNEEFSLPEGIGNLVCLRHLQLCIGGANVKVPESIGDLFHLTVLEITCSGLVELPDTLRNLVSLTTITFCRFRNEQLPALGQLPYLRALTLSHFHNVKSIGNEFCRGGGSNSYRVAFPSLTSLVFKELTNWKRWDELQEGDFPQLQKLEIKSCRRLSSLPSLRNLSLLWHINLDLLQLSPVGPLPPNLKNFENRSNLKLRLPQGFGELKKLERLSGIFGVRMGDAFGILKKLPSFKNLSLSELRNVQRAWNDEACLRDFGVIEKLILNWGPVGKLLGLFESSIFFYPAGDLHLVVESDSKKEDSDDGEDVTSENSVKEGLFVLEKLQPHTNLKELHIIDYDDAGYPSWMGHPSFDRLNHIQLQGCKVDQLPTLGQLPSLTRLYLHCIYGLKGIGEEFCRGGINEITNHIHHVPAFPSLNNLHFESMYDWEQWDDGVRQGDFPKLESLSIYHCPRLSQLSVLRNLGMNLKLSIHYCPAIHIPAEAIFPPNVKTLLYKGHNPMIYLSPGVELQNLQSLEGVFRARNHELFEILNSLPMNTDRLTIAALRNVRSSVMEVEANLKSQHRLDELTLKWSTDDITYADRQKSLCLVMKDDDDDVVVVDGRTDQTENASFILLEKLQPHINLWLLHITDYDGIRYPSWIGHPSFNRLTAIRLSSCKNDQLPTLGQLPSLCGLSLDSISGLKRIGHEFCRDTMMNNDKLAFPSLFSLSFEAMHDWQEWCGVLEHDFPRLEMFTIQNCPRLSRDMISLPQRLLKLTSRGWIES